MKGRVTDSRGLRVVKQVPVNLYRVICFFFKQPCQVLLFKPNIVRPGEKSVSDIASES